MADCCLKLKERMGSLTIKEQQVATFILDYPEEVINMSINDLADSCGVSVSSVVRLCKSIGYSGYKELCRMLSADLLMNQQESVTYEDVRPGDSIEAIMRSVCLADMKAIESTMSLINVAALQRAVEAISKAQRVDFYGVGTSGYVAMDARNKFLRINKVSMPSADSHDQILCAATLKPDDVAVAISYTGDTKDILEAVGEDPDREGLRETPDRVARMYGEIFSGLDADTKEHLKIFQESGKHDELVFVKDIPLYSVCEHHLLPFIGKAHIAYIPDGRVVGLSKLARTVEVYARRAQIQEKRLSPKPVARAP